MRRLFLFLSLCASVAGAGFWWLTRPTPLPDDATAGLTGDVTRGEQVFRAAGCASCHADPDIKDDPTPALSGGYRMESPFGTFVAPNISPSKQGIGGWSIQDLANAMVAGLSPGGKHFYPAFPYTTYANMTLNDIADLKAFLDTLPPSDRANEPHELAFPFTIRRGIGVWKRLNLKPGWVMAEAATPELERGRYLVEALGHCAECHTPRDAAGGLDRSRWMAGAPNPSGKGTIPPITPDTLKWSERDIEYYLETGLRPDFDTAGGQMVNVIRNLARLPASDRQAIAAYLMALR